LRPQLAIFDLNSRRVDPLATIAALKADSELAGVRTLGFVSHVQTEIIDAARRAGIDEVLARSAFSARVGEILRP
jgi:PleD family two-component response regulator